MPYMIESQPTYLLPGKGRNEVLVIPLRDWGQSTHGIVSVLDLLEKQTVGVSLASLPSRELFQGVLSGLQVVRNYTAAVELIGNNTDLEMRGVVRVVASGVTQLLDTLKVTDEYPHYKSAIDNALLPLKITNP